jgi:hypothetical protein
MVFLYPVEDIRRSLEFTVTIAHWKDDETKNPGFS